MNDQELESLLTVALQVDHSPDFLARVRRRVDLERRAASWIQGWRSAVAVGALAAAAVVVAVWLSPPRAANGPARLPSAAPAAAAMVRPVGPLFVAQRRPDMAQATSRERQRPKSTRAAQVLVAPEDRRGLELAVRTVRSGGLPAEFLAGSLADSALVLQPLQIAPLNIEPLPEIVQLQGDHP